MNITTARRTGALHTGNLLDLRSQSCDVAQAGSADTAADGYEALRIHVRAATAKPNPSLPRRSMPAATHELRQALGPGDGGEARLTRVEQAAHTLLSGKASPARERQIDLELCANLNLCMQRGDFWAACGLVRAVLNSPPGTVDHARMMALLTARAPCALPAGLQALSRRLSDRPHQMWAIYSQALAVYVHRLATLDEDEHLQAGERLAPTRPELHLEPPMLHRLCGGLSPDGGWPRPSLVADKCNAILLYLSDVLGRHCLLVDEPRGRATCIFPGRTDVAGIFAARHAVDGNETTAAQLALRHGHPAAAAIMVLAIQDSAATPSFKQHLLEQLDVDVGHVLRSLSDTEVKTPWINILISRLKPGADCPSMSPPRE